MSGKGGFDVYCVTFPNSTGLGGGTGMYCFDVLARVMRKAVPLGRDFSHL